MSTAFLQETKQHIVAQMIRMSLNAFMVFFFLTKHSKRTKLQVDVGKHANRLPSGGKRLQAANLINVVLRVLIVL
jgi:hypothetical protein